MKIKQGLMVLVLGAGIVASAHAKESPWYIGITGGAMLFKENMDVGGGAMASPEVATNIGVMGGYLWSVTRVGSLAVEGEFTDTASRGNYSLQGVNGTVACKPSRCTVSIVAPARFILKPRLVHSTKSSASPVRMSRASAHRIFAQQWAWAVVLILA